MNRLDLNATWREASALVAANREMFLILGGVFFMLPSLAMSIFVKQPEVEQGMDPAQMMAQMSDFYGNAWWLILLGSLFQVVGIMTILTLMRDRSRPTVGEAIRAGAIGTPSYLAAQILLGFGFGALGLLFITALTLASAALGVVATLLVMAGFVFVIIRTVLVAPLIAVDGVRSPIAALRRSWALTRGNFWRIFAFLALIAVLFIVVLAIVMLLVGIVLALLSSGETQRVIAAVFSSALTAVAVVYFAGILAAMHRQLAGPTVQSLSETFD